MRMPIAVPDLARQSVGRFGHLFQRDPRIFPSGAAGSGRPGTTSRCESRASVASSRCRFALEMHCTPLEGLTNRNVVSGNSTYPSPMVGLAASDNHAADQAADVHHQSRRLRGRLPGRGAHSGRNPQLALKVMAVARRPTTGTTTFSSSGRPAARPGSLCRSR
jgi:hypothetical protein